jgi:aspartyl-tRNA(Asn)/glutamyl-tRNA(Gln) amidotransferase subunit A
MKKSFITPIVDDVRSGTKTASQYVKEALQRITQTEEYNVVIAIIEERAKQRAQEIDQHIQAGRQVGRLAGVPFIAKDNFLVFGADTTAASNILKGFDAPYQAEVINRLEAEGAICIAKANLDAFAHGSSTENSDFGPTKNPVNSLYVPGGSSGGSAAAVALDIVPFALGTDTGGSIRLPASYCGVVGLKPSYGRSSRYGVVAMASSTDVIGPLTKTAYDSALILDIIAGKDQKDGTTLPDRDESYLFEEMPRALKIGVIKEYMSDGLDSDTKAEIMQQIDALKSLGHIVEEISLPAVDAALAVYYVVVPAEISSNLARYDGIRYGFSAQEATKLSDTYEKTRSQGFNEENKRRIMIGNYVLSSGYYDAYYKKAQTVRTLLVNEFNKAFETYDLLIGPTAPNSAFKLGENIADPLQMYLVDIMTVSVSLAGLPAISIPAGTAHGMPVGLQVIGKAADDKLVLQCASQLLGEI